MNVRRFAIVLVALFGPCVHPAESDPGSVAIAASAHAPASPPTPASASASAHESTHAPAHESAPVLAPAASFGPATPIPRYSCPNVVRGGPFHSFLAAADTMFAFVDGDDALALVNRSPTGALAPG